ncbi:MAG TPA: nucleoside triphosphate pyrophosphatase [Rhizomicrobium sp.]|nr:nucleoside triphosphate pyrophosphatase [Rhizomicrobium sp.]
MKLILASASRSRAQMLKTAGVPFEIIPAHVDEESVKQSLLAENASARDVADALAELKAVRISASHPGALVLGADQVLVFGSELVSKCGTLEEAVVLLRRLRGKSHELISAAVLAKDGAPIWRHVDKAVLRMRAFSDEFLKEYLAGEGEGLLSGVGCYRLESRGAQLFERIDGDYFTILGLPLIALLTALRQQGILAQ